MYEILEELKDGVDVSVYANSEFDVEKMKEMRLSLIKS